MIQAPGYLYIYFVNGLSVLLFGYIRLKYGYRILNSSHYENFKIKRISKYLAFNVKYNSPHYKLFHSIKIFLFYWLKKFNKWIIGTELAKRTFIQCKHSLQISNKSSTY